LETATLTATLTPSLASLHAGFLELLPRLEQQAGAYFRFVKCPQKKDDLTAEAVAIAWSWYRRLMKRGKNPHEFAATFIHRALCQARSHRRLCGQQKGKDVL
jgi:DNA-directed RNA polymerase specialized sigma24 family protein